MELRVKNQINVRAVAVAQGRELKIGGYAQRVHTAEVLIRAACAREDTLAAFCDFIDTSFPEGSVPQYTMERSQDQGHIHMSTVAFEAVKTPTAIKTRASDDPDDAVSRWSRPSDRGL